MLIITCVVVVVVVGVIVVERHASNVNLLFHFNLCECVPQTMKNVSEDYEVIKVTLCQKDGLKKKINECLVPVNKDNLC